MPKKPIYPKPAKFQRPTKSVPKFQQLLEKANLIPGKISPFQRNKLLDERRFEQNTDMFIRDQNNRFAGAPGGFAGGPGPGSRPRRPFKPPGGQQGPNRREPYPNLNELRGQRPPPAAFNQLRGPPLPVGGRRKSTSNQNSYIKGARRRPGPPPPRRFNNFNAPNLLYHEFEPSFQGSEKFGQDLDTEGPGDTSPGSFVSPEPGSYASSSTPGSQAPDLGFTLPARYQPTQAPSLPPPPANLPPAEFSMPKFPHFEDPFVRGQGGLGGGRRPQPQPQEIKPANNQRYGGYNGGGNSYNLGSRRQETFSLEPEPVQDSGEDDNSGFFAGAQESFPDLADFGMDWDPQKVVRSKRSLSRTKRSPMKNPFYYSDPRTTSEQPQPQPPRRQQVAENNQRRRRPGYQNRRPAQQQNDNRRQGPKGFWDDADFDAEFFNGGGPNTFSSFDEFSQGKYTPLRPSSEYQFKDDPYPNRPSYADQNRYQQPVPVRDQPVDYRPPAAYDKYSVSAGDYQNTKDGYSFFNNNNNEYNVEVQHDKRHAFQVVQDKEPERNTYTAPNKYYFKDPPRLVEVTTLKPEDNNQLYGAANYEDPPRLQQQFNTLSPEDNEILGSGNFDVIKGGTFYEQDEVRYQSGNHRPSGHSYGQDFFNNFRDFADIKKKANKGYYY
jgi:hypothetical protein